jgi:hypothetical protein
MGAHPWRTIGRLVPFRLMTWSEVRQAHPDHWLVIEALAAHSAPGRRVFDEIAVVEVCPDGRATMRRYGALQRAHPGREFCFVHSSAVELIIEERGWRRPPVPAPGSPGT